MSKKITKNHINDDFDNFESFKKREKGKQQQNGKFKDYAKERDLKLKIYRQLKNRDNGI